MAPPTAYTRGLFDEMS